jgi:hypothetical protein
MTFTVKLSFWRIFANDQKKKASFNKGQQACSELGIATTSQSQILKTIHAHVWKSKA